MKISALLFLFFICVNYINAQWNGNPAINAPVCTANKVQSYPKAISDGNGGAIVCWQDFRNSTGLYGDIYAQHIDKNGVMKWGTNGMIICAVNQTSMYPKIISDENGGAIIAWIDHRYQNSNTPNEVDVFAQRVDGDGNIFWRKNGVAIDSIPYTSEHISITKDGNGGAYVAWDEYWENNYNAIFAQHVSSNGTIISGDLKFPHKISYETGGVSAFEPQLVPDGKNGFIVTWYDNRNYQQDDIFAQHVNSSWLELWDGTDLLVCGASYDQKFPEIIPNSLKGAIITWDDNRAGTGVPDDVYAQSLDSNGKKKWLSPKDPWYNNNGIPVCTSTGRQFFPQLTSDGSGGTYIAWTDERYSTFQEELYVQHINSAGDTLYAANGIKLSDDVSYPGNTLFVEQANTPSLLTDDNNNLIIVWSDERSNGDGMPDLYSQKVAPDGTLLWQPSGVAVCTASGSQMFPQLILGNNNNPIAVWQDERSSTTSDDIYTSLQPSQAPLPVSLFSFTATYLSSYVSLQWKTATEINSDHFDVERSSDGVHFSKIGTVASSNNSSAESDYTFTDTNPVNGISYYRLKQVDIDGQFTYSIIISVKINTQLSIQIMGNPVYNSLQIEVNGIDQMPLPVSIIDASGKRYKIFTATDGSKQINIADLSSGVYYLIYQSGGNVISIPFIKQ